MASTLEGWGSSVWNLKSASLQQQVLNVLRLIWNMKGWNMKVKVRSELAGWKVSQAQWCTHSLVWPSEKTAADHFVFEQLRHSKKCKRKVVWIKTSFQVWISCAPRRERRWPAGCSWKKKMRQKKACVRMLDVLFSDPGSALQLWCKVFIQGDRLEAVLFAAWLWWL